MPDEFASAALAANVFAEPGGIPVRLSGTFSDRPAPDAAVGAYYYATDRGVVYESTGKAWIIRGAVSKGDVAGHASGLMADRPSALKMIGWIYHATDTEKDYEAFPSKDDDGGWYAPTPALPFDGPANTSDTRAKLRSALSNQFGTQLKPTAPATYVVMQTLDASPTNPYVVRFEQFITEAFTGDGQFDLVERDARRRAFDGVSEAGSPVITSEEMNFQAEDVGGIIQVGRNPGHHYGILSRDGDSVTLSGNLAKTETGLTLTMDGNAGSEVTIATKAGFADGDTTGNWSRLAKSIERDKVYSVVSVPGDTGAGVFPISARALMERE